MKNYILKVSIAVSVLLFVGCASVIQTKLDSYIGRNILEAQKHFGFSFTVRKLRDGGTTYKWTKSRSAKWTHQGMGGLSTNKCVIFLVANSNGKIISTQFRDTHSANTTCLKIIY